MLHKALLKVKVRKGMVYRILSTFPTYVMTLKKTKGRIGKMFAMVAISDYTIVGVGNTMESFDLFKNVCQVNKINPNSSNKKIHDSVAGLNSE
jgi:hypothetical protein